MCKRFLQAGIEGRGKQTRKVGGKAVGGMSELKPCPFCGGKDIRLLTSMFDCDIWCSNCGASVFREARKTHNCIAENKKDAQTKAVRAWNRRVDNER